MLYLPPSRRRCLADRPGAGRDSCFAPFSACWALNGRCFRPRSAPFGVSGMQVWYKLFSNGPVAGSWAFLIGSVIQWYESLNKLPVEKLKFD